MGGVVFLPCYLTWGQTMVEVRTIMVTSFKKSHVCTAAHAQCPWLWRRPPPTHASVGDSWTIMGKSGPVSGGITAPFSWVLVHTVLFLPSKSLFPQSCVSSGSPMVGLMVTPPRGLMLYPGLLLPEPLALWQATADPCLHRRPSNTVLAQSLWDLLVCTRCCLSPLWISDGYGIWF